MHNVARERGMRYLLFEEGLVYTRLILLRVAGAPKEVFWW